MQADYPLPRLSDHGGDQLKLEEEADVSSLENQQRLAMIKAQVRDALSQSDKALCSAQASPTTLDHYTDQMSVVTEESLRLMITVIHVTTLAEVIK